ncbi:MAG TPA: sigma-70 family RNA polymerase sigma factor [Steroidobacteraceae bacterium]|nr:sigma-70 family RNA polymerase sigma factor [Steroidobacteraceae bacterium]
MSVSTIITESIAADAPATPEHLAARILAGDALAEGELVRKYERGVLMILMQAVRDLELARDLRQDTFVIVLNRLRATPLDDPSRLAAFIAQTARNLAIAEKRREVRRRTDANSDAVELAADDAPSRESQSELESSANAVRRLLAEMKSPRDRMAIVRFYLDEESKESICADLGVTELQFNVILFRARERFRQLLEDRGLGRSDLFSLVLL